MPFTHLSTASSLNPGAELWIIPSLDQSRSAQRLDWYMNLQLTRSTLHKTQELGEGMKSILDKAGLSPETYHKSDSEFVLFESSQLLPNRWLIQINSKGSAKKWVESASTCWSNLQKPSLRVFLPTGLSTGEFQKFWKGFNSFDDFTVVVD